MGPPGPPQRGGILVTFAKGFSSKVKIVEAEFGFRKKAPFLSDTRARIPGKVGPLFPGGGSQLGTEARGQSARRGEASRPGGERPVGPEP